MKKLVLDNNHFVNYNQHKFNDTEFTILFLHGLKSDNQGTKSLELERYCIKNKINYVAFDNLGHGSSSGEFKNFNISSWLNATIDIIQKLDLQKVILVGSSMGGWLSLLVSKLKLKQIHSMILIAPAPDFTSKIWKNLDESQKLEITKNKMLNVILSEGQPHITITLDLLENGEQHTILKNEKIEIDIPVIIIHGMNDKVVDYQLSMSLSQKIQVPYLCTKLIKNGGHRLSEKEDLKILFNSVEELMEL